MTVIGMTFLSKNLRLDLPFYTVVKGGKKKKSEVIKDIMTHLIYVSYIEYYNDYFGFDVAIY